METVKLELVGSTSEDGKWVFYRGSGEKKVTRGPNVTETAQGKEKGEYLSGKGGSTCGI